MSVCLFSKETQTAGRVGMKFGTEVVYDGGRFWGGRGGGWGGVVKCIKGVQGASGASAVRFGENFIKQKL